MKRIFPSLGPRMSTEGVVRAREWAGGSEIRCRPGGECCNLLLLRQLPCQLPQFAGWLTPRPLPRSSKLPKKMLNSAPGPWLSAQDNLECIFNQITITQTICRVQIRLGAEESNQEKVSRSVWKYFCVGPLENFLSNFLSKTFPLSPIAFDKIFFSNQIGQPFNLCELNFGEAKVKNYVAVFYN